MKKTHKFKYEGDDQDDLEYNIDMFVDNLRKAHRTKKQFEGYLDRTRYASKISNPDVVNIEGSELKLAQKQGFVGKDGRFIERELETDEKLHMQMAPKKNVNQFNIVKQSIQAEKEHKNRYNMGPPPQQTQQITTPLQNILSSFGIQNENLKDLSPQDIDKLRNFFSTFTKG